MPPPTISQASISVLLKSIVICVIKKTGHETLPAAMAATEPAMRFRVSAMVVSSKSFLQGQSYLSSLQTVHVRHRWRFKKWELATTTAPEACM
jgi:hypothetical protein